MARLCTDQVQSESSTLDEPKSFTSTTSTTTNNKSQEKRCGGRDTWASADRAPGEVSAPAKTGLVKIETLVFANPWADAGDDEDDLLPGAMHSAGTTSLASRPLKPIFGALSSPVDSPASPSSASSPPPSHELFSPDDSLASISSAPSPLRQPSSGLFLPRKSSTSFLSDIQGADTGESSMQLRSITPKDLQSRREQGLSLLS